MYNAFVYFRCFATFGIGYSTKKCKAELQSILAHPQTYSENYLRTLSSRLAQFTNLLFTNQANSVASAFEQQYGVTVTLHSPFPTCSSQAQAQSCFSTVQNGVSISYADPIPFTIPQSGKISSISIENMQGELTSGEKSMLIIPFFIISLQPPNLTPSLVLNGNCDVSSQQFYNLGFSDSSTVDFNCANVDSGLIFQPTNPFSQFIGVEANGEWNLILDAQSGVGSLTSFTIEYCIAGTGATSASACSLSSDITRSDLNIPGYRSDSGNGNAYYTTVFRNAQGQELYATISRSLEGMF